MQITDTYQPSTSVLQALQNVTLVAIVGPTGSGKTTLIRLAAEKDSTLHPVVGDTTRNPRPEEREGVDYFFRDKQAALSMIARQEYVQISPQRGEIYGTHIESYAPNDLSLMGVLADVIPVFRALPFKSLRTIFIVPASYEAWQSHVGLHNFTPEQRAKRFDEAKRSLQFALDDPTVELLINDDLAQATTDLLAIIHRPADVPMPDQTHARQVAQSLLDRLITDAA